MSMPRAVYRVLLLVTTALTAITVGTTAPPAAAEAASDVVTVETGSLRGTVTSDYRQFAGIPYAAPPVGALRWAPPEPAAPWAGIRNATAAGAKCPQGQGIGSITGGEDTSEDCLYLNVWTPNAPATNLPVLVWIHGGSLTTGAGSTYGAQPFMTRAEGPMVVVTVNYRLGALGFLAAKQLETSTGDTGNYGFQDQQLALKWVQRNISAFGGDPAQVTVAGESAGAISTCAQLAAPSSAGLFRAAVMQSGPCMPMKSKLEAEAADAATVAELGCPDPATAAECLRALPTSTVLDRTKGAWNGTAGTPFLPLSPYDAMRRGKLAEVPVLTGSNHDERALWTYLEYGIPGRPTLAATDYPQALTESLGGEYGVAAKDIDAVIAQYPLSAYAQPVEALTRAWSDQTACNIQSQAAVLATTMPTYGYEFSDPNPPAPPSTFPLGAYHASELPYLWQLEPALGLVTSAVMAPAQRTLSDQMVRAWSRFVITGSPDPTMPRYSATDPQLTSFRPAATAPLGYDALNADHRCDFWRSVTRLPA